MKGITVLALVCLLLGLVTAQNPVFTEHTFDEHIGTMKYLDHQTVLILSAGKLFRSTNAGDTWATVTLPKGDSSTSTSAQTIHVSKGGLILCLGNGQSVFYSKDNGATFKNKKTPAKFSHMEWHPSTDGWVLGSAYVQKSSTYDLWFSRDHGESWQVVAHHIIMNEVSWGDAGVGQVSNQRFYFVQSNSDWSHFHFCYTDDFGQNIVTLNKQTITAVFRPNHIFVLSYSDDYSEIYLRVSPDVGKSDKVFMRAEFPWGEELENSLYSIEDDTYKNVWMGINHGTGENHYWGHLYHSEPMGVQYTLSIPYIYFSWPHFDFHRAKGLDGVYISNTIDNPEDSTWDHRLRSWITHDQGRNWDAIPAPKNHQFHCEDENECFLHLHGWSRFFEGSFGPFYSADHALGIIVGTGNVGEYLTDVGEPTGTFISSDGGSTFTQIFNFATIYEISNHGGLIVFARLGVYTREIHYTFDYGKTVKKLPLATEMDIRNIVAEDRLTGTSFIVEDYGGRKIAHLNFKPAMGKTCTASDYEDWKPVNPNSHYHGGKECLMGRQTTYKRRKPSKTCVLPEDFDDVKVSSTSACECTDYDFVCDYGYYHDGEYNCHRDDTVELHDPPLWCVPGRKYTVTDGYVLESGNGCSGGVSHSSVVKDCPKERIEDKDPTIVKTGGSSHTGAFVAIGIIVPLIVLILVGAYFAMNSEQLRERLPFLQTLFNLKEGYSQFGGPGGQPGALFDDEEYIIGPLDDRNDEEEADGLKTVDLNSNSAAQSEALNADLEEFK